MAAPVPSFFKMRLVIAAVLFFLGFFLIGLLNRAFSASCDYSKPSGTCGITSSSFYDCEEDLLEAFNSASGSVVWSPFTCFSGCCLTTYGLPSGTQFWQKGTAIFVLCPDGVCGSECEDTDGDGVFDPCDPCPDDPEIDRQVVQEHRVEAACDGYQTGSGEILKSGDYCGYSYVDCEGVLYWVADGYGHTSSIKPDQSSFLCCEYTGAKNISCEVDGNCESFSDVDGDGQPDGDCVCPDGQEKCAECEADPDGDGELGEPAPVDSDGDGLPDDVDPDPDNPDTDGDGIPDGEDPCPLDADCDDDGVPDGEDPDYIDVDPSEYSSEIVSSFGTLFSSRFQLFIDRMKQTSLLSLPNRVFGDIPSGGDPVLIIDGGVTYGEQRIDFSDWSSGLAVFRAVIYVFSAVVAFRIVTLKR